MLSAMEAANFFVTIFKDTDDGITNLKLQKLLYYAQGTSYQRFGTPLFDDEIEAWENGPVVNVVYQKYKRFSNQPIRESEEISVAANIEQLLIDVAREYGKYATWTLVDMTHKDGTPWKDYYIEGESHVIIPKKAINKYFREKEEKVNSFDWDMYIDNSTIVDLTAGNSVSVKEW